MTAKTNLVKAQELIDAAQYSVANQILLAGKQAGEIKQLPGMRRRNVALNQFVRDGLAVLSGKSWIRSEIRHAEAHNGRYMGAIDHPDNICASCERTLGEMFSYGVREYTMRPQATVASYEVVRVVPRGDLDNDRFGSYFCFDCAINRQTILDGLIKQQVLHRYRDCIAADKQDVFEFVAQTILEDRLHGRSEYNGVELRMLHGGAYGSTANMQYWAGTKIGGRLIYHETYTRPLEEGRLKAVADAEAKLAEAAVLADAKAVANETAPTDQTEVAPTDAPVEEAKVAPKPKTRRPAKHAR